MTARTEGAGPVTPIAAHFFAGRYGEVLAATLDSPRAGCDERDTPFVIGALSFVGRIVEAELLLDHARAHPGPHAGRALAAGGFFFAVALGRAGQLDEGRAALMVAVRETGGRRDAWCRALLHQGVAALRFFAGDYRGADQAARRALSRAQAAHFPYGMFLANDMRGHVLLRVGRFHEGLALLARARDQARTLDFTSNAHAIEIAIEIQRAVQSPIEHAVVSLEALLEREEAQDSYSRRAILSELVVSLAWAGQASRARARIEELAALCAGSERATCGRECAQAQLARVTRGWPASRRHAERARELLGPGVDLARDAEIEGLRLGAAVAEGDDERGRAAADALCAIVERTGFYQAHAWLAIYGRDEISPPFSAADPDRRASALRAVTEGAAALVIEAGYLGLLAEATGRSPGRRLHLRAEATLIEDHGDVERLPALSPRLRQVLDAMEAGHGSREALLREVWGIRAYRPARHDAVIKTTVSRLRSALGRGGAWVITVAGSYDLAPGVEVVRATAESRPRVSMPLTVRADHAGARRRMRRWSEIAGALGGLEEASVSELARRVGAPVRTLCRDLTEMCEAGLLVRAGAGRATRYHAGPRIEDGCDVNER